VTGSVDPLFLSLSLFFEQPWFHHEDTPSIANNSHLQTEDVVRVIVVGKIIIGNKEGWVENEDETDFGCLVLVDFLFV